MLALLWVRCAEALARTRDAAVGRKNDFYNFMDVPYMEGAGESGESEGDPLAEERVGKPIFSPRLGQDLLLQELPKGRLDGGMGTEAVSRQKLAGKHVTAAGAGDSL